MITKEIIEYLSCSADCFYIYDEEIIISQIKKLKSNFHNIKFLYSIKANPNLDVLKCMFLNGFGADAASLGEVMLAKQSGLKTEDIYFSAPGKTPNDIINSINNSVIIADSFSEIENINKIAFDMNINVEIGIRINPNFTFLDDNGLPSKFGIDEEQIFQSKSRLKNYSNIKIVGIHTHLKSQELNHNSIFNYYQKMFELAIKFQNEFNIALSFLNLGSGLGIQYSKDEPCLNVEELAHKTNIILNNFKMKYPKTKIIIETGRFVIGNAGYFVTKVLDKKVSRGKTFIILKDTLNSFMRSVLTQIIDKPIEPLFTCKNSFQILTFNNNSEFECVTLTGNICSQADIIANDIKLQKLDIGDFIALTNAGSYALTLSPINFSSKEKSKEFFISK